MPEDRQNPEAAGGVIPWTGRRSQQSSALHLSLKWCTVSGLYRPVSSHNGPGGGGGRFAPGGTERSRMGHRHRWHPRHAMPLVIFTFGRSSDTGWPAPALPRIINTAGSGDRDVTRPSAVTSRARLQAERRRVGRVKSIGGRLWQDYRPEWMMEDAFSRCALSAKTGGCRRVMQKLCCFRVSIQIS